VTVVTGGTAKHLELDLHIQCSSALAQQQSHGRPVLGHLWHWLCEKALSDREAVAAEIPGVVFLASHSFRNMHSYCKRELVGLHFLVLTSFHQPFFKIK